MVLCLTGCVGCAVSSSGRKSLGVGGRVLLISDRVGEDWGDLVAVVFSGIGRGGLRRGRGVAGVEGTLVWIFNGEGEGAGLAAAGRKGFVEPLA